MAFLADSWVGYGILPVRHSVVTRHAPMRQYTFGKGTPLRTV